MRREAESLAPLCGLRTGITVAEVGAGNGKFALQLARLVRPTGRVFVTEAPGANFARLCKRLARVAPEIAPVPSAAGEAGLPPGEVDAIVMRGVYHHLTQPAAFNASLRAALLPGGVLAVIDFPPRFWLSLFGRPAGVPANRGGHGIPPEIVREELTAAGFRHQQTIHPWRADRYCMLFENPAE